MGIVCANPVCNICTCLSCCGYNNRRYPISQINKNWMEKLAKMNPSIKLRDAIIPGTHNSGTYTIEQKRCCSSLAITQNKSIYGQLLLGARLLDLRVAGHGSAKDSLYIQHGPIRGALFVEAVNDVLRFITENPNETVFFGIDIEFGFSLTNDQLNYLYEMIKDKLGKYAVSEEEMKTSYNIQKVTIREAYTSRKKVLVLVQGSLRAFTVPSGGKPDFSWGYLAKDFFLDSKWYNTNDRDDLFNEALWNIQDKQKIRHRFINTQMMLSGQGGSVPDLVTLILGCNTLRVDNLTSDLIDQNELEFFMREFSRMNWNMIWYDFIDFSPYLTKFMIGLNYTNHELKIIEASLTKGSWNSIDVTQRANQILQLCRSNTLFIIDFTEDFDLYELNIKYGTFKVTYEYGLKGGEMTRSSSSFVFSRRTKFLLNMDNASSRGIFISDGVEVRDGLAQGRNGEEVNGVADGDGGRVLDTEMEGINPRANTMISPEVPNADIEIMQV